MGLALRVGPSIKKLDPTVDTSPVNIFATNNQDPTLLIKQPYLNVVLSAKVTTLHPILALAITCERLRTWKPM